MRMYPRDYFPAEAFSKRRNHIEEIIESRQLDAVWIHHSRDLYYFCGTAQTGHFIRGKNGSECLLIRNYPPRAVQETDVKTVIPFRSVSRIEDRIRNCIGSTGEPFRMGIVMDVLPVTLFQRFQDIFSDFHWVDISSEIRWLRAGKSDEEVEMIRRAAQLLDSVFDRIPGWLAPGISELDLAAQIEYAMRREGHQGSLPVRALNSSIHYGNVLFGSSGAVRGAFDGPTCGPGLYRAIPKGAGWKSLAEHEPVFVDIVAGVGGYLADATRIYCLGHLPDKLSEAHENCLRIQKAVVDAIRPGTPCETPYNLALKMVQEMHLSEHFMGPEDNQARFIAHGIGLEIDEFPILASGFPGYLKNGHVIALEPKAVFPGVGAVGIENTWVIRENGPVSLTEYPDAVKEVDLNP